MDLKSKPSGLERSGEVVRDIFRYCSSATHAAGKSELYLMLTLPGEEQSSLVLASISPKSQPFSFHPGTVINLF